MHDLIERLREAFAHETLERIFGHPIVEAVGGFLGSVAAHIVADLVLVAIAGAAAWFAWFELPGRLKARSIRRGDPNRLNILVARFEGHGGPDIRDRIREQMHKVFGEVTARPFDVFYFPVTLRDIESGGEKEHLNRVERKARRWMLAVRDRKRVPLQWATTQDNLGTALQSLGERDRGTRRLEEAVAAYGEALKERTRERVPLDWAATQNNLGSALFRLGERESGIARLER
jgi:tetratricopeptide (TPR) repeat protein